MTKTPPPSGGFYYALWGVRREKKMANLPETIANMAFGKGVYQGDAKFLMPDGSVMDKDGKEIVTGL